MMVNRNPLIRPCFLGVRGGGSPLDSHDLREKCRDVAPKILLQGHPTVRPVCCTDNEASKRLDAGDDSKMQVSNFYSKFT